MIGFLCISLSIGLFFVGLRPFHAVRNEVTWLPGENGLRFGDFGTILSSNSFQINAAENGDAWTLEMWLKPGIIQDTNTLLAFYTPLSPSRFSLHQYNSDLGLTSELENNSFRVKSTTTYVDNVFREERPVFLTITSGARGTAVYENSILLKQLQKSFPASYLKGQLIVGNSPISNDSWSGNLRGLAFYATELAPSDVARHYQSWTSKVGRPDTAAREHNTALYLLTEHSGTIVHNAVASGVDLYIPQKYTVLKQTMLEPFWKEVNTTPGYRKDVAVNVTGFIPYGFFLCAYWVQVRSSRHPALVTIMIGFAVSLTIEVLQAYLPTRDSSGSDVVANTLGTAIGVAIYYRGGWRVLELLQATVRNWLGVRLPPGLTQTVKTQ